MYDSDYNALINFLFEKTNWSHNFLEGNHSYLESDKKIENILHASIKISENFDINYPRWSKVASYNFVKNGFNHKRFFVSWRFAEQNSHWYKKCNGPKV